MIAGVSNQYNNTVTTVYKNQNTNATPYFYYAILNTKQMQYLSNIAFV